MEAIFHEKQEGSLCAQHCLNSLLQGPYFTAVDLSILAQTLDDEERVRMAECGVDSEEYRNFIKQPSGNMDDSGYFSIQVIGKALQVWNLEIVPLTAADVRVKNCDPTTMQAFICNYQNHWFTIRKIANRWFNLNSLLTRPELISDTYLSLFLAQLRNDGYSIFVILGDLLPCPADDLVIDKSAKDGNDDEELQTALKLSLSQDFASGSSSSSKLSEEEELQKALMLSLSCDEGDELNKAIALSLIR